MTSFTACVESPAATVVEFQSRVIDEQAVRAVREKLPPLAGRCDLELDLGDVDHVTAGGMGALVLLRRQLFSHGVILTLSNVKKRVYDVFELTQLTRVLGVRLRRAVPVRRCF